LVYIPIITNLPILIAVKYITFIPKSQCETSLQCKRVYVTQHVLALTVNLNTTIMFSCSLADRMHLKCDGTHTETRFCLLVKRTSPFKSAGASVQSTTGSRVVHTSGSNAGYTMFRGSVRVLATHSIREFSLHFPSCASPCAITFQLDSTTFPFPDDGGSRFF
jgi:hypothetical protein